MLPLRRAWRNRALVTALTRRELAARYRGGLLGYFWSLVNPLLLLAVYATVFRLVFTPRADVRPYALFLFIGVLAWSFVFSASRGTVAPGVAALAFPAVLALLALTVFGLALAISSLAVHFADIRDVTSNLLTLAFFLTPVLYPVTSVPERYRELLRVNPFSSYFTALHDSLFFFHPIAAVEWAWMAGTAALSLAVGALVFERLRDSIAEEA